ncbi:hypothetical protein EDC01DRAFT_676211, partial [Geopyxis carbonaria]
MVAGWALNTIGTMTTWCWLALATISLTKCAIVPEAKLITHTKIALHILQLQLGRSPQGLNVNHRGNNLSAKPCHDLSPTSQSTTTISAPEPAPVQP